MPLAKYWLLFRRGAVFLHSRPRACLFSSKNLSKNVIRRPSRDLTWTARCVACQKEGMKAQLTCPLQQAPYNSNLQHGDAVILDSLDLALLVSSSASKSVLTLAYLDLTELPPLLHILPLLEQWYSGFGSPENGTNVFDGLDLRHNHLTGGSLRWTILTSPSCLAKTMIKQVYPTGYRIAYLHYRACTFQTIPCASYLP